VVWVCTHVQQGFHRRHHLGVGHEQGAQSMGADDLGLTLLRSCCLCGVSNK
jgi:hypothetical protein